jgi:hypothetical protein
MLIGPNSAHFEFWGSVAVFRDSNGNRWFMPEPFPWPSSRLAEFFKDGAGI